MPALVYKFTNPIRLLDLNFIHTRRVVDSNTNVLVHREQHGTLRWEVKRLYLDVVTDGEPTELRRQGKNEHGVRSVDGIRGAGGVRETSG